MVHLVDGELAMLWSIFGRVGLVGEWKGLGRCMDGLGEWVDGRFGGWLDGGDLMGGWAPRLGSFLRSFIHTFPPSKHVL